MTADLIFFQFRTRGTEEKEVFLMPPQLERRAPDRVCKFEVPYLFPYLYEVEVDESGEYRNDECTYEKTESYLFAERHQVYNIRRGQKRKNSLPQLLRPDMVIFSMLCIRMGSSDYDRRKTATDNSIISTNPLHLYICFTLSAVQFLSVKKGSAELWFWIRGVSALRKIVEKFRAMCDEKSAQSAFFSR